MDQELRILALEDCAADAQLETLALRKAGLAHHLERVETRDAFIKGLKEFKPDILLVDYNLPSMNGIEALAIAQREGPDVPFIFVTGAMGEEAAVETLKKGATDYVLKSNLARLAPAVRRALEEAQVRAERRKAREALQESRDYLDAIINAIRDPIFVKDRRHRWVLVNDALCSFMGHGREELIGKSDPDYFPKEQVEGFWAKDDAVLETGRTDTSEELLTDSAGQVRTIITVKARHTDPSGDKFIVGSIRDITERVRAEAEKAKADEQFHQAQKMEAVGLLAGGIAHDFSNVLTTIVGYNYLVLDGLQADHPLRPFSLEVQRATELGASLSRQLLAVSRRQVARPRVMELNSTVIELAKLFRRLVGENIKVVVEAHPSLWPVKMDNGPLEQILLNLVVNARDAMPQGGQLTIATRNITAGEAGRQEGRLALPPGHYVCLRVSDTGIGMDAAVQARIFEPFFTTKTAGRGTGLGLATVQGIVKDWQGHIFVESAPGQGATFRVCLPRAEGGVEAMLPEKDSQAVPGGGEAILVVEDHAFLLNLLKKALRRQGYRVFTADNGARGLELCRKLKQRIDLVLMDLVLPDINGGELFARMEALRPGLKVVYMSGYPGALMDGANLSSEIVFIEKPFPPGELHNALRRALDAGRTGVSRE